MTFKMNLRNWFFGTDQRQVNTIVSRKGLLRVECDTYSAENNTPIPNRKAKNITRQFETTLSFWN